MIRGILEADWHCGHLLGLTSPDHWKKKYRRYEEPLWDWRAGEISKIGPVDFHGMLGDLVDGPGVKESIGLLTTDMAEQVEMATEAAEVVQAKYRFICYGTPLHTVSTSSHEGAIAKGLGCEARETWRLEFGGRKFHFRHVVGRSDIPYGQGTQVAKEIVRDELQSMAEGFDPAEFFARAHVHYYHQVETAKKTAFTLPALMLPNPDEDGNIYARKLRTMYYDVGFVLVEIDQEGEVYIRKRIMPLQIAIRREYLCPLGKKKKG